jgi:hypothetical protein
MTTKLIYRDEQALEELAYRENDGIEISLRWSRNRRVLGRALPNSR